ncbi:glycosyltransferase [Alteribacter natronophilus]|nr:glycosyltransferase [Alteribacter natronophilus]
MSIYINEKPEYFKQSIDSMLNQSVSPEQIVIVKDGELTQELDQIIMYYSSEYGKKFTIVPLERNVGLGLAINAGLEACRNELVARMDTDDISLPNRCELQLNEFATNPELVISGTNIDEFYDEPENIISSRVVPQTHEDILKFGRRRNPFNHPTVMYKKSIILKMGGYKDFRRNQDLDLFINLINSGYKSSNIDKSLLLFRANRDNLKRRKSWTKCSSYIKMIYTFWRKGYSELNDLLIVALSQTIVFLAPIKLLEVISDKYLRNK